MNKDCPGWIFKKHDYDIWKIDKEGEIQRIAFYGSDKTIGYFTEQKRICKNCGYTQIKIDRVMI